MTSTVRSSLLAITAWLMLMPANAVAQGGSVDASFATGLGADDLVMAIVPQSNGKILIGGFFTEYDGAVVGSIARLNSNGSLDNTFSSGVGFNNAVQAMAMQSDGKILVGGTFTEYNGTARNSLVRLNATGTLDPTFVATAVQGSIHTIAIQTDGKILIGGAGVALVGGTAVNIARLSATGSLDATFDVDPGPNNTVQSSAVQTNGKILASGFFTTYHGATPAYVARVEGTGLQDAGFQPGSGPSGAVRSLAVQPDGKILITGSFTTCNGVTSNRVARLLSTGALDPSFSVGVGANSIVHAAALQPDGKILIGGLFTTYNGSARNRIARLNANGTVDATFNVGTAANDMVRAIAVQSDGKILVGGGFTSFNSAVRGRITRLHAVSPIVTGSINGPICPGAGIAVPFTINGSFLAGNVFTAELSNSAGSFIIPTVIGTLTATSAGTVNATIPQGTASGAGYRIRIVSSSPLAYATDNNSNIAVSATTTYYGDADADGLGDPATIATACSVPVGYVLNNTDLCPQLNGTVGNTCNDGNTSTVNDVITAGCQCLGTPAGVRISPKVFLEGPFVGAASLMNDGLRSSGQLPLLEPYSAQGYAQVGGGGETVAPGIFSVTGNNAIVDWVLLELRNGAGFQQVMATRSALVQRDGDVVDLDGTSPISFEATAGSYAVVVRHRNHLGVMTAGLVALGNAPVTIDFTLAGTSTYGSAARKTVGSKQVLWAGDVAGNGMLMYTGTNNDRDPILAAIGGALPTNTVVGTYAQSDTNLDGVIKYVGVGNDRDIILINIGGTVPTAVRVAQLP